MADIRDGQNLLLELQAKLLDRSRDCIFALDELGNIVYANLTSLNTYGYSLEEFLGKNIRDLTTQENTMLVSRRMQELREKGEISFRTSHFHKNHSVIPLEIQGQLITIGDLEYIVCISRDITELQLAENVLERSEERFRTILEDMDNGYFELDSHSLYTFTSDAMCKILGFERSRIISYHFESFIDPADEKFLNDAKAIQTEVFNKGGTLSGLSGTIIKEDGSKIIIGISASPIKDSTGKIIGVRGIARDITDRIKNQQQMLVTNKLASVGQLAAGVAHEINNPLTAIIGYAQLLKNDENVPESIKSDLDSIYEQSQRAAKIIQNLLIFAQSSTLKKKVADINELILKMLDVRSYRYKTGKIKIISDLQTGLPGILVDEVQIQQVFLNILLNAEQSLAAQNDTGVIKISTKLIDNKIIINIFNDGPSIPKNIVDRLFDPFFSTKDVGQGTGLGLSICHGIVTNHGGRIYAESDGKVGATFVVELPITNENSENTKSDQTQSKKSGSATKGKQVLIVDDEAVIRNVLSRILEERGYVIDLASSGTMGLEKIGKSKYDAYILDMKMPGVDGREMYETIGQKFPSLMERVIFITGDTISKSTLDFLDSTGRTYFSKPLNFAELVESMEDMTA
jgi:PAS domain S-box-containing protein